MLPSDQHEPDHWSSSSPTGRETENHPIKGSLGNVQGNDDQLFVDLDAIVEV